MIVRLMRQVCMALYSDPPHIKHTPKIMPETELPQPVLTSADRPREEPLWCERHGLRMNNRNGYKGSVVRLNFNTVFHSQLWDLMGWHALFFKSVYGSRRCCL